MEGLYKCEWGACKIKFWSIIDLEQHVRKHVDDITDEEEIDKLPATKHQPANKRQSGSMETAASAGSQPSTDSIHASSSHKHLQYGPSFMPSSPPRSHNRKEASVNGKIAHISSPPEDKKGMGVYQEEEYADDDEYEYNSITCCICRGGEETPSNYIVLCDRCDRPYHQQCHRPFVGEATVKDREAKWYCKQCTFAGRK